MRLADIKPTDVNPELRMRIECVMRRKKLAWPKALDFLAREVVAPNGRSRTGVGDFFHQ